MGIGLVATDNRFFTDFISVPEKNKVYIVRNDFQMYEVTTILSNDLESLISISYNGIYKSFSDLLDHSAVYLE